MCFPVSAQTEPFPDHCRETGRKSPPLSHKWQITAENENEIFTRPKCDSWLVQGHFVEVVSIFLFESWPNAKSTWSNGLPFPRVIAKSKPVQGGGVPSSGFPLKLKFFHRLSTEMNKECARLMPVTVLKLVLPIAELARKAELASSSLRKLTKLES